MGSIGKKTITETEIADQFVITVANSVQESWPSIAKELSQLFQISDDKNADFEFTLAVIATGIQALPNLLEQEQASRIRNYVLNYISSSAELGSYPKEAIEAYQDAWNAAREHGEDSIYGIASVLFDKLECTDTVGIGGEKFKSPILLITLGGLVVRCAGPWWKNAIVSYNIVPQQVSTQDANARTERSIEDYLERTYVPCSTSGCNNTPLNIDVRIATAMLEYDLRNDSGATFPVDCERCGQTSKYNHAALLQMMGPDVRPRALPLGQKWAIILAELDTPDTMEYRGFFGERVLVQILDEEDGRWVGRTLRQAQFAPSLSIRSEVRGCIFSGFYVCQDLLRSSEWVELPVEGVPHNSVLGCFFLLKEGNVSDLQCANLFCSNPSCGNIFGLTYSKLKSEIEKAGRETKTDSSLLVAGVTGFKSVLSCELCGNGRVVDLESFDGLFKV